MKFPDPYDAQRREAIDQGYDVLVVELADRRVVCEPLTALGREIPLADAVALRLAALGLRVRIIAPQDGAGGRRSA